MLQSGVDSLKGIGAVRAEQLARLGIRTVEDLLLCLPRSYLPYDRAEPVAELRHGQTCAVRVQIVLPPSAAYFHGMSIVSAAAADGSGQLRLKWYNQPYRRTQIHAGDTVIACGRIDARKGLAMLNPSVSDELPGLLPVYPLTKGLTQRLMRDAAARALPARMELIDPIPADMRERFALMPLQEALLEAHRPQEQSALDRARRRLTFEGYLYYMLSVELQKQERRRHVGIPFDTAGVLERYLAKLPFPPTAAQRRVMAEIAADMAAPSPMNRLLQGDVGSGKTAVALYAICIACANGYQSALMAPTEILAEQHYESLRSVFGEAVCLVHGGMQKAPRRAVLERIAAGSALAVVGTHALLQEDVRFARLGLVVTDEQHRFGVAQRALIAQKGVRPDVLVMSATPIPRTLALLLYGDLDVSVIDELPPGRKPVKTSVIPTHRREAMYAYLARRAAEGAQSYVVCPLIEETEGQEDSVSAEGLFRELTEKLKGTRIALLHGRMSGKQKQQIIESFRAGMIDVLVSTTVIEVGVHVPNASIMVIEGADRFGLAQLHQLRGRVGRSSEQAYCFLLSEKGGEASAARLSVMTETNDGFLIAEQDLAQRGPGDLYGTRQHGMVEDVPGGDLVTLELAAQAAREVIACPSVGNNELLEYALARCTKNSADIAMN